MEAPVSDYPVKKSEDQWREQLANEHPLAYAVAREAATERAFTGQYWDHWVDADTVAWAAPRPCFRSDTSSMPAAAGPATTNQ